MPSRHPNTQVLRLTGPVFALILTLASPASPASAASAAAPWHWPTTSGPAALTRGFQAPLTQYGSGHRGVDLQVRLGEEISAPALGVVLFNGLVARIPTLVLDHGAGLVSTYQPLVSELTVGDKVKLGSKVGTVTKNWSHCSIATCLHWGVRNSTGYLDPLKFVKQRIPVLLPILG